MRATKKRCWKRGSLFAACVAAFTLAAASIAWACTPNMSQLTVCRAGTWPPNCDKSAVPGTKIRASNRNAVPGLTPGASYNLKFNNANRVAALKSCHSAPYIMKSGIVADPSGWFDVTAFLPATYSSAPKGQSEVCGVESSPSPGLSATTHAKFSIV